MANALSVLRIKDGFDGYALWRGNNLLLTGSQEELFHTKNLMEEIEQQKANDEWRAQYREQLLSMLAQANGKAEAETFLKKQMPYLFQ